MNRPLSGAKPHLAHERGEPRLGVKRLVRRIDLHINCRGATLFEGGPKPGQGLFLVT